MNSQKQFVVEAYDPNGNAPEVIGAFDDLEDAKFAAEIYQRADRRPIQVRNIKTRKVEQ